jgi:hypothetical protein
MRSISPGQQKKIQQQQEAANVAKNNPLAGMRGYSPNKPTWKF